MASRMQRVLDKWDDEERAAWMRELATRLMWGTFTWNPPDCAGATTTDTTLTTVDNTAVTGLRTGMLIAITPPSTLDAGLVPTGWVPADDQLTIRILNTTAGAINPVSATWGFMAIIAALALYMLPSQTLLDQSHGTLADAEAISQGGARFSSGGERPHFEDGFFGQPGGGCGTTPCVVPHERTILFDRVPDVIGLAAEEHVRRVNACRVIPAGTVVTDVYAGRHVANMQDPADTAGRHASAAIDKLAVAKSPLRSGPNPTRVCFSNMPEKFEQRREGCDLNGTNVAVLFEASIMRVAETVASYETRATLNGTDVSHENTIMSAIQGRKDRLL